MSLKIPQRSDTEMPKRVEKLVVMVILILAAGVGSIRYFERPTISQVKPTLEEQSLMNSSGTGQFSIYKINRRLPAGSIIRIWVETYESGNRVDDIAMCEFRLSSPKAGLPLSAVRQDNTITLNIAGEATNQGVDSTVV